MRQTVMGVFDSYADACSAQQSLNEAGVAQADIAIYSMSAETPADKGPRVYAPGSANVGHRAPVFDRLEQLFARLFESGKYPPEAEDYREFVRRGGTIVCADVSEMQVEMARDLMRRTGAADIEDRSAAWRNGSGERHEFGGALNQGGPTARESSAQRAPGPVLEEDAAAEDAPLSQGSTDRSANSAEPFPELKQEPAMTQGSTSSPVPERARSVNPVDEDARRNTAFTASEPTSVSGMEQVTTRTEAKDYGSSAGQTQQSMSAVPDVDVPRSTDSVNDDMRSRGAGSSGYKEGVAAAEPAPGAGLVGDPIMGTPLEAFPYDDEFRREYDARYANTGSSYEEYRRAYTHGTTLAQDERYAAQDWQSVEPGAREDWESRYPESGWERFKAAARHGWERVRGL